SATAGQNSFALSVSGLTASTTYSVQVDGTSIGHITTNVNGARKLVMSNLTTTITAGSALTPLDDSTTPRTTVLQGTFAPREDHYSESHFTSELTGASGTSGSAHFVVSATAGENSLKIKVSGLAANTTYTVEIGGTSVGSITTDGNGAGKVT